MEKEKQKRKNWCESEKITLMAVYPYIATKIVAERFGTTYGSVERMAMRLGIKKDEKSKSEILSNARREYHSKMERKPIIINNIKLIYTPNHPKATKKNGYRISEHILVMEKFLGRYLEDNERVIHRDGNPQNNNLSNLYIQNWTKVNSLNVDELIEKRKNGYTIDKLKEEYNLTNRTLYKILLKKECVKKKTSMEVTLRTYCINVKKVINGMLDLWLDESINYSFNEDILLYYQNVIKKEGRIGQEKFEELITNVLKKRNIEIVDLT